MRIDSFRPIKPERALGKPKEAVPSTLDIISVDGRWGQVISPAANKKDVTVISWLDGKDPESSFLDLTKYSLLEKLERTVGTIKDQFSVEELEKIYWGPEQEDSPGLRLLVTVFGKYIKKT